MTWACRQSQSNFNRKIQKKGSFQSNHEILIFNLTPYFRNNKNHKFCIFIAIYDGNEKLNSRGNNCIISLRDFVWDLTSKLNEKKNLVYLCYPANLNSMGFFF